MKDVISKEKLAEAIKELDSEEFKDDELTLIFNEIAGAAKKPNMRNARGGLDRG